jgi:hypothetical protein
MKFRNINLLNHFMINDQYKLDIVDRQTEISLLTKSGSHYSSSLNRRDFQICKSPRLGKEEQC